MDSLDICAGYGVFPYNSVKFDPHLFRRVDTVGGVRETSDWCRYTIRQRILRDVSCIVIARFVSGKGTTWFDNIEIRIDEVKYEDKAIPALKTDVIYWEKKELHRYVHPLQTYDPKIGNIQDFDILKQTEGNCPVVGLGENMHSAREEFKQKNRIICYVVENTCINFFALEVNMPECYQLNNYTICRGNNPVRVLFGIYIWPWWTWKILDRIEWMNKFNASNPHMTFTEMDMQNYRGPIVQLQSVFDRNPSHQALLTKISDHFFRIYICPPQIEVAVQLDSDLEKLAIRLDVMDMILMQRDWALRMINLLYQFLDQRHDLDWRDRLMWIMQHNAHVNSLMVISPLQRSMGYFLNEQLKKDYQTLKFEEYEGTYTAWKNGLQFFDLPQSYLEILEYVLIQLDEPLFIQDLRKCEKNILSFRNVLIIRRSKRLGQRSRYIMTRKSPICLIIRSLSATCRRIIVQ